MDSGNNRDDLDNENEEEENEEEVKKKGNEKLIQFASRGQYDDLKRLLEKKQFGSINHEDKKKWTALMWAACKNHVQIVRLLIEHGAHSIYVDDVAHDKRATLGIINTAIKQTPLQWASFKGNLNIVWLLINAGMKWDDIDSFGNNCVHLAASGGNLQVFQVYMMLGVDVTLKNSRCHEVLDLSTNPEIITLVKAHKAATKCSQSNEVFSDSVKKHWCSTCGKFFSSNFYKLEVTWETHTSSVKERIDGKCTNCWDNISKHSNELEEKMREYEEKALTQKLSEIEQFSHQNNASVLLVEIDLKLLQEAKVVQERLRTQNEIKAFIQSLTIVENYKTILKSSNQIKEMRDKGLNTLDAPVLEAMQGQIERLNSERNLRFELDNLDAGNCNPEQVRNLEQLLAIATEKGVAKNYLEDATVLKEKMARSIQAKDIYKQMMDYPIRAEYIEPIYIDFKTKKPFDPITKKPADLKVFLLPPPKKKKKEPKFVVPDWANDLKAMNVTIQALEELLKAQEELQFSKEFVTQCGEAIVRMKRELKYRKGHEVQDAIVLEYKNAQKKKK